MRLCLLILILGIVFSLPGFGQELHHKVVEVGETMKEYIRENHIEDIENIVHQFTSSRLFLNYLLEQGHHLNPDSLKLRRKDVNVGDEIDIYVKHFTEHQSFTMLLVPVDIYPLAIYDTLLFAVLEVSDEWLTRKYYFHDLKDDSIKSSLLASESHDLLGRHMLEQVLGDRRQTSAELEVKLYESYISTSSIFLHANELEKKERKQMMESWSIVKRVFTHNIELNVEMNIYIFGYDDMRIVHYLGGGNTKEYQITPENVFTRHHFLEK